jgi:hypothetical protein
MIKTLTQMMAMSLTIACKSDMDKSKEVMSAKSSLTMSENSEEARPILFLSLHLSEAGGLYLVIRLPREVSITMSKFN